MFVGDIAAISSVRFISIVYVTIFPFSKSNVDVFVPRPRCVVYFVSYGKLFILFGKKRWFKKFS